MSNLTDYLKTIADAIRSKKGTTEPINAQNFASEIASISGGGGGAYIATIGGYTGTAVPESGLVDKVYINTALTIEQFKELAQKLNFVFLDEVYVSACVSDDTMQRAVAIMKYPKEVLGVEEDVYLVAVMGFDYEGQFCFQTQDLLGTGWVGWDPAFTGVVNVNMENLIALIGQYIGYTPENENLKGLFSTTPFVTVEGEVITLSGEYKETKLEIVENGITNIKENVVVNKEIPLTIKVDVPIPEGYIVPTGAIEITQIGTTDVTNYATAQVNDSNLVAENIRKDKTILGVKGTLVEEYRLAKKINQSQSAAYLFSGFNTSNWEDMIKFEETSRCNKFDGMFSGCSTTTVFPLINTKLGIRFDSMYMNCTSGTSFPLLDTSNGQFFQNMYQQCVNATTLPLINTSKGIYFNKMYFYCQNLTNITQMDVSNGIEFQSMFSNCYNLTEIKLNNSSATKKTAGMFASCSKIKKIDLNYYYCNNNTNLHTPRVCGEEFLNCSNLETLILRSFYSETPELGYLTFSGATKMLNGTGYVYVPRNMIETLQNTEDWNKLQFRALEDYTIDGTTTGEFDDEKAGLL